MIDFLVYVARKQTINLVLTLVELDSKLFAC